MLCIRENRSSRSSKTQFHINPGCCALRLGILLLISFFHCLPARAAETAKVSGVVFTVGADRVRVVWPNARITLKNLASASENTMVSDYLGEYRFTDVVPGDYGVQVDLAGFRTATKQTTLKEKDKVQLDFQLEPEVPDSTIEVTSESGGVDVRSSSGGAPELKEEILKSAVRLSTDFQDILPLLPGVVRGPDGLVQIKGGRTNQANALVNTASIADPFTGQPALRLPAVAVASIRVLSNPYSAEYGGFASGVVEVNTRGGTDQWRWLFEDPMPRFRWIDWRTHGVESASPHLVVSGPVIHEKLYLFQSTSYNYDTIRVPSLPDPDNVRVQERVNSHTQVDWNITKSQRFTAVLTVDPQQTDFATIDTFNPQPVTASYRQRGFFTSATHRWILPNGGFIQSVFSAKRLDPRVFPADRQAERMVLFPEQNSGTFFAKQDRRTRLYQWSQSLHLRPIEARGRHLLTLGYSYIRANYQGSIESLPVSVHRPDGTLSREISHGAPVVTDAVKDDWAVYVQDSWQVHPRLVLDLGLRLERDSLSAESLSPAPRAGFVYAPGKGNRTAIRGGLGVFFDKIPLNVAVFPDIPRQTITRFAADGVTIVDNARTYTHVVATDGGRLRVPYSLGWSAQFDRQLSDGLFFRFGYEQREVFREFYLDPFEAEGGKAELRLLNSGRQSYRELLWMLRWEPTARTTIFASYVRSNASGELNDYNQFFGNFPYPLIRSNQRGRLAQDAPDRVLFWGVVGLPHKLDFVPVLDVHTGFPYSKLDQDWEFIGRRNEAGRFPTFVSLDTMLQYPFDFKFRKWHFKFRAGFKVYNVLNHFNPRDVQQNVGSPEFGGFYNSIGRLYRLEGAFDF
jgi:hypothetical protein